MSHPCHLARLIGVCLSIAVVSTFGCGHEDAERAADIFADCLESGGVGYHYEKCADRSGWVVDMSGDNYTSCLESQAKEDNGFATNPAKPLAVIYHQIRRCVRRTGHLRTFSEALGSRWRRFHEFVVPPDTHYRAPWRGTAWDNPDSIKAGLNRGDCWPLVERQDSSWIKCSDRQDSAEAAHGGFRSKERK